MKSAKYKRTLKTLVCLLFAGMLLFDSFVARADDGDAYFYSFATGEPQATVSPTVYQFEKEVKLSESGTVGAVEDFCRDAEGNWYIADSGANQIIVLDKNFQWKQSISDLGEFGQLKAPGGVCIGPEQTIYIADTGNGRLVICNQQGEVIEVFDLAQADELRSDFAPSKVECGTDGQIYVISKNDYSGIIELDEKGTFLGYIGAAKVTYSVTDYIWKQIMTETQKDKQIQFIPVEYVNLSVDEQGFIYTVSSSDTESAPVKRLNPSGSDVLSRNGYTAEVSGDLTTTSALIDVSSDSNGLYHVLDRRYGRIFTYDTDGYLLYVFGGIGSLEGQATQPVAITSDNEHVYELDKGSGSILVFEITDYAKSIVTGIEQYNSGNYEDSLITWEKVLKLNSNYEIAYAQIGKSMLRMGNYEDAMYYFELGNFRGDQIVQQSGYNKAFTLYRDEILTNYWWMFILAIVVLYIFIRVLKGFYNKSDVKVIVKVRNSRFMRQCRFSKNLIFHPFKGFWDMKREKEGSLAFSIFLMGLWIFTCVFEALATGFLFSSSSVTVPNVGGIIRDCILIVLLITAGNWCVTTLMGGEGSYRDIVMAFGYATIPLTLIKLPLCIVTNFLTYSEMGYVTLLETFAFIWFFFLLFFGMQTIHQYSLGKSVGTALLTCFAVVVIIFVAMVFLNLLIKMAAFITAVYKEIMLR